MRLYIFGARCDVASEASFRGMIGYFRFLASVHTYARVTDIIAWVPLMLGQKPTIAPGLASEGSSKDMCLQELSPQKLCQKS